MVGTPFPDHSLAAESAGYCECGCGQKTALAKQSRTNLGHVRGQPVRFIAGHPSRLPWNRANLRHARAARKPPQPVADRFWGKVAKGEGCWLWTGATDGHGYGVLHLGTRNGVQKASRISWDLHYGPVPDGLHVCHHCDNPPCVRPDHLFLGAPYDNMHDAMNKGRIRRFPEVWKARLRAAMKGRRPKPEVLAAGKRLVRERAIARHEGHDITVRHDKFHCRTCSNAKQRIRRGRAA